MSDTNGTPREVVDARRAEVREMMLAGRWVRGKSAPELAAKWGLSVKAVEHYSTEAARSLRMTEEEREELRRRNLARLDEIFARTADSEPRVAVTAIAEQNKMLGLLAPTEMKVETTQSDASPAKVRDLMRAHFGQAATTPDATDTDAPGRSDASDADGAAPGAPQG